MYQVFNMGHRMELYVPEYLAGAIIEIASRFNLGAQIIGRVESHDGEKVTIDGAHGRFEYT